MAGTSHQIVALKKLVNDLYGGLASMTASGTTLVATVASNASMIQSLASSAVTKDGSGNVTVTGSLIAGSILVGSMNLVSAIAALQSAVATKQAQLTAGSGISIASNVISLSYGVDTTVTASSNNLVTSGAVAAAIAGGYILPIAGSTTLGAVKVGSGLSCAADGTLTSPGEANVLTGVKMNGEALGIVSKYVDVPAATTSAFGVVKIGSGITVKNGVIGVSLPSSVITGILVGGASASTSSGAAVIPYGASDAFGVLKVGAGLFVRDGVVGTSAEANVLTDIALGDPSSKIALSSMTATIPFAASNAFGIVKIGSGLSIASGVLSTLGEANVVTGMTIAGASASISNKILVLPSATSAAFGVVKIDGTTLMVNASGQLYVAGGGGSVSDVQINGSTILSSGVANIPLGTSSAFGVVKVDGTTVRVNASSQVYVPSATTSAFGVVIIDGATLQVNAASQVYVRSATSSLAGVVIPDYSTLSLNANGKLYAILSSAVTGVKIGSSSIVQDSVATIPYAASTAFGVVKVDGVTIQVDSSSVASVPYAGTDTFGVVKIDGTTVRHNGSSQLYVPSGTSSVYGVVKYGTGLSSPSSGDDSGKVVVDFTIAASRSYVDTVVGNINAVLEAVLGE